MTLISCWQRMEVGMPRLGRVLWSAIYCYFINAVARVCAVHIKTRHARGNAIACCCLSPEHADLRCTVVRGSIGKRIDGRTLG